MKQLWRKLSTPSLAARLAPTVIAQPADQLSRSDIFIPSPELYRSAADEPFMQFSTCSARDFFHPRFAEIAHVLDHPVFFHRKLWEYAFILNTAFTRGIAKPGRRAIGFGVGREPIPAALAKYGTQVLATDAPKSVGVEQKWNLTGQYANNVEALAREVILDRKAFLERVTFEHYDMNALKLSQDFDFCWSCSALDHLGSISNGLAFIFNSVQKTLKLGGIACHTTELNLSSNDKTIEDGEVVLFRKKDLDGLISNLRARGHVVDELRIAPDSHHLDAHLDIPPYKSHNRPHLKINFHGFAVTSVGLVVQRGA